MLLQPRQDLSKTPLASNPNGDPPNFIDPPTLAPPTRGIIITLIILSFGFVAMRFFASFRQHVKFLADDYFCLSAWLLATVYGISAIIADKTARHAWDVPLSFLDESWLKNATVGCIAVGPTLWCAKTSIALLYIRLFGSLRWVRIACWIVIAMSLPIYWHTVPLCAVWMFPHGKEEWNLALAIRGSNMQKPSLILGAFNIVTDLYLLLVPLPIIYGLNLSIKKRIGLFGVFMTAILGLTMSTLALYYRVSQLQHSKAAADSTWTSATAFIVVSVEMFITIIVGCVPGCASFWNTFLRDSALMMTLRSIVNSSRSSLSRRTAGSSRQQPGPSDSVTNLHGEFELDNITSEGDRVYTKVSSLQQRGIGHGNGITKLVEVDQKSTSSSAQ